LSTREYPPETHGEARARGARDRVVMLRSLLPAAFAVLLACGGTSNAPAGAAAADTPTFTFSATGLSPPSLTVANGGCILVRNGDPSAAHSVEPNDLTICPELIGGTTLAPGTSWDWCGFRNGPKTCGFHDPNGSPASAFSATIQVSAP
jgi:hypothetical protein